jgi:hypothetical protein
VSEHRVVLELAGEHKLARDLVAGGVFVPGYNIALNVDCELVLRGTGDEVVVSARVVWSNGSGIGLQLHNCDAEMKGRISALANAASGEIPLPVATPVEPAPAVEETPPPAETEAEGDDKKATALHERLRGLTMAQQIKIAAHGELNERILLERIYGKTVWESLLRNPRITGPEVARIARMGTLPRPQLEQILNNGGWLGIPEVRRALLTNPRIGTDQVLRILRLLPKHELKMATMQTTYPLQVRDAAKKLMKEHER